MSLLDTINELGPEKTELLYSETIDGILLTVRQYQTLRWLSVSGEMIQSLMNVEHPEQLLLPNLTAMLAILEFTEKPKALLNLGAGAGSLQRYLISKYPKLEITSVECSQAIIELAKRFFNMNPNAYIVDTAEHFLAGNTKRFDIILVDIYNDEKQPACLYQDDFYRHLALAAKPGSVIAFNLLPESEEDLLNILRPLNQYVKWILLHEVPNHDNVIVYALTDNNMVMDKLMNKLSKIKNQSGVDIIIIASNV